MERLILDTGVLVALERGRPVLADVVADEDDVSIAAITAAELLVGVELATRRHRAARASFVEAVLSVVSLLPYDLAVARRHARLLAHARRAGRPRGAHDLQIAATATTAGRTLLTTDARAFADLPDVNVRVLA